MITFGLTVLFSFVALAPLPYVAKRRPRGTPLTWGEALVAGVYAFLLFWWVFGVVPHWWLTWADNELGWREDSILWGPANVFRPQSQGGWLPFTITMQAVRDIVVVVIYAVYLGLSIAVWALWQGRGEGKPEIETTAYGRPLVRKGA